MKYYYRDKCFKFFDVDLVESSRDSTSFLWTAMIFSVWEWSTVCEAKPKYIQD